MVFLGSLLGILGFGIGIPLGLLVGFYYFVYSEPKEVEVKPIFTLFMFDDTFLSEHVLIEAFISKNLLAMVNLVHSVIEII